MATTITIVIPASHRLDSVPVQYRKVNNYWANQTGKLVNKNVKVENENHMHVLVVNGCPHSSSRK